MGNPAVEPTVARDDIGVGGVIDDITATCRRGRLAGVEDAIVARDLGERFAQLREEISAEVTDFVFIEIVEEGAAFEMSGFGGNEMARVGREVLASSLPSALMFELAKGT